MQARSRQGAGNRTSCRTVRRAPRSPASGLCRTSSRRDPCGRPRRRSARGRGCAPRRLARRCGRIRRWSRSTPRSSCGGSSRSSCRTPSSRGRSSTRRRTSPPARSRGATGKCRASAATTRQRLRRPGVRPWSRRRRTPACGSTRPCGVWRSRLSPRAEARCRGARTPSPRNRPRGPPDSVRRCAKRERLPRPRRKPAGPCRPRRRRRGTCPRAR